MDAIRHKQKKGEMPLKVPFPGKLVLYEPHLHIVTRLALIFYDTILFVSRALSTKVS